jgi:hypothetical protein
MKGAGEIQRIFCQKSSKKAAGKLSQLRRIKRPNQFAGFNCSPILNKPKQDLINFVSESMACHLGLAILFRPFRINPNGEAKSGLIPFPATAN